MFIIQPAAESTFEAAPPFNETANLSCGSVPAEFQRAYPSIAGDLTYQHFVLIPDRIIQCVDYLQIGCNRVIARARLDAYYLFIGVVDESIDSGQIDTGRLILDCLNTIFPFFDEMV